MILFLSRDDPCRESNSRRGFLLLNTKCTLGGEGGGHNPKVPGSSQCHLPLATEDICTATQNENKIHVLFVPMNVQDPRLVSFGVMRSALKKVFLYFISCIAKKRCQ